MSAIRGIWANGQFVPAGPAPADWPEGANVQLELVDAPAEADADDPDGILGMDPESIARWIAALDELHKTSRLTDEQAEEWDRHMRERKESEKAMWEERSKKIGEMFP